MEPNTIRIVDLDNTISDDAWRHWLIDPEAPDGLHKYHEYHLHCSGDTVMNRHIVDEAPCKVFFMTARPEYMRLKTRRWLEDNDLHYDALIMRPNDNEEHSAEMKRKFTLDLLKLFKIEKAYDDRQDIIQMYNSIGVKGILV
jgi:hypothetical protein